MDGIMNLLNKISIEDIEKLQLIMSLVPAMKIDKPESESKDIVTLRVFMEEYKVLVQKNRSTSYYRSVTIALNYLSEYFKSQRAMNEITLHELESFLIYLQQKVKKGYVVYYRNLKAAFNKANDWGYVNTNHFTKIKLPKRQKTAPAYITTEQLSAISEQIKNEVVKDLVMFAFYTGMRLNEIVNLKWKNINLSSQIITVGDEEFITKGRNQRFIPICEEALTSILSTKERKNDTPQILRMQNPLSRRIGTSCVSPFIKKGENTLYVFSKPNGVRFTGDYISKTFKDACKKAGIDKSIHFHSLRHSFASHLVQRGVSLYTIKELLGHSSISTTEIYSHLNIDSLRDAVERLNDINATASKPHPRPLSLVRRGEEKTRLMSSLPQMGSVTW